VVLFLQSFNLQMGRNIVLGGTLVGLVLSGIVAVLTFLAHRRLPYRKMLVLTGIMLGFVLLVMVGEQAQEMQLAGWIPTTKIDWLANMVPDWMGVWFAVYPTIETLVAAVLVIGSYYAAPGQTSTSGQNRADAAMWLKCLESSRGSHLFRGTSRHYTKRQTFAYKSYRVIPALSSHRRRAKSRIIMERKKAQQNFPPNLLGNAKTLPHTGTLTKRATASGSKMQTYRAPREINFG
jgi:hypothetical protein